MSTGDPASDSGRAVGGRPIRLLLVDDCTVTRKLLAGVLSRDPEIEVVATAVDGLAALQTAVRFEPDAIALDLHVALEDGLSLVQSIVSSSTAPVLVMSADAQCDCEKALAALAIGAVDVIPWPRDVETGELERMADELRRRLRALADQRGGRRGPCAPRGRGPRACAPRLARQVVVVGASTGGPPALTYVLRRLPADIEAAVIVAQHMPRGFTAPFAARLNEDCALPVVEARGGEPLLRGRIYIAPGGRQLHVVGASGRALLLVEPASDAVRYSPSVDLLFQSVAARFGTHAVGVLMTGMGDDGAAGLEAIRRAGGRTLVQDEESSVASGMPRAAILRGAASEVWPLERLSEAILGALLARHRPPAAGQVGVLRRSV